MSPPSDLRPESRETLGWGQLVWKRFLSNRIAVVGGVLMGVFLIVAVLAPWVAPHDPLEQDLYGRLAAPTLEHPFGTDDFGRDILSRVIYGTLYDYFAPRETSHLTAKPYTI